MSTINQNQLKEKLELVVRECFKKAKEKRFIELNFVFPKGKSENKFLNQKIELFKNLDEYSQTFLSIHTRAKVALREFQNNEFDGAYLELLRLILTLPDSINKKGLKSVNVSEKMDRVNESLPTVKSTKLQNSPGLRKNTKLVKEGLTGAKITKQKKKEEQELEELQNINFEFHDEEENYDNIKFD